MPWQVWVIIGFLLLALELFIPTGFYIFILGVGCILTGVVVWTGITSALWVELVICAVLTLVCLFAIRKRLMGFQVTPDGSTKRELVGDEVMVSAEIAPGAIGKGEARGTSWNVKNVGDRPLASGGRYRVQGVEGLTLLVKN